MVLYIKYGKQSNLAIKFIFQACTTMTFGLVVYNINSEQ